MLGIQTPAGTATSTYNSLNQIELRDAQPFVHDAAGNLTDDGVRTYAWDAEQRLVRIGYTGTGRSTSFRYDALGRRTALIESDGTSATETRYLWCGERICQARDGADSVTRRYYDEGELAVSATGDIATFYAEDHLGSIRDLRIGDGRVLASYDYDPYGAPTRSSETGGVTADYRYAGLVHHAPSGLYLANYRAYSPAYGRWLTRDPIFEAGGVNLYAYVLSNPLRFIDPRGLASLDTDMGGGTTTFDPRPEDPNGVPTTIPTRTQPDSRSQPGAGDPTSTPDVNCLMNVTSEAYGPPGTYIDTGDPRGRDIHGGGTGVPGATGPRQSRLSPTRGCTRGYNDDLQRLCDLINDFKSRHPGVPIPYTRRR